MLISRYAFITYALRRFLILHKKPVTIDKNNLDFDKIWIVIEFNVNKKSIDVHCTVIKNDIVHI